MIEKDTHVDDWIATPEFSGTEAYAKFVLIYKRMPAWMINAFTPWMNQFKLFCTYEDKRWRVTGASRLGDVWLAEDFNRDIGYDKRVSVSKCSEWGDKP